MGVTFEKATIQWAEEILQDLEAHKENLGRGRKKEIKRAPEFVGGSMRTAAGYAQRKGSNTRKTNPRGHGGLGCPAAKSFGRPL